MNFSSHAFTRLFLSSHFPIGIQANNLQLSEDYWTLGDTINNVINLVSINGGWTIIGWYSRGVISDKTLTTLIPNSSVGNQPNQEVQVDRGELTYHFCKIIPTDSSFFKANTLPGQQLHQLKYNVNQIRES